MKEITKDYLSLQNERSMYKNVALHLWSYIPIPQYWPGVSCTYDILHLNFICLVMPPT